jgi:hypothetical protein
MEGEQAPVQIGQFILAKNLGIGAFGKVRASVLTPGCFRSLTFSLEICIAKFLDMTS